MKTKKKEHTQGGEDFFSFARSLSVAARPRRPPWPHLEDDDDDQTFAKEYRESEANMLLPAKEADFRTFLCDSGATEEIVRLLVGLAEAADKPADPVAFLRAKFDAQELPSMVSNKPREDIPALLAENEALRTRTAELEASVADALSSVEAAEASAHGALLEGLLSGGACGSDAVEGALDVAKLYAAASAKFPPPPEAEEGAEPPPPQPWAAEDAVAPTGSATRDALAEWAKAAFGYGSALLASHAGLSLQLLVSAAAASFASSV